MIGVLKPYKEYKASVLPDFSTLPAHWALYRLRHVVDMLVSNVDKHSKEGEQPIRLCNYINVYKNENITERIPFMHATATRDEISRFRLRINDVLITKDSEEWTDIAVPSLVKYDAPDLVCGYHLAVLRPDTDRILGRLPSTCPAKS